MKQVRNLLFIFLLIATVRANSQVAIGTPTPHSSAQLDVTSTTKGLLPPRMTSADRDGIITPAAGLLVWCTNCGASGSYSVYNGTSWELLALVGSTLTPSTITSTQNDYAPSGWAQAKIVRLSGNSSFQKITGFAAGTNGEIKILKNVGSFALYLAPEHIGSSASNRVNYHEEVILYAGSSAQIYYDGTLSRWGILVTPSPGYVVPIRSRRFDDVLSYASTAAARDNGYDYLGSIQMTDADATSTEPFNSFNVVTGAVSSGGGGMNYPRNQNNGEGFYYTSSHIVVKTLVKMPAILGDATNDYFYNVRLADNTGNGFFTQNNSIGIYYRWSDNGGKFWLRSTNNSGTSTETDSGVPVAAGQTYDLQVSFNKAGDEATFWIDGVVVGRHTTNLPSAVAGGWSTQLEKLAGTSSRTAYIFKFVGASIME